MRVRPLVFATALSIACSSRSRPPVIEEVTSRPPVLVGDAVAPTNLQDAMSTSDAELLPDDSGTDAGPPDAADSTVCDPAAIFGAPALLSLSNDGLDEFLGTITIAWTTESGHVHYSDRASTAVDFQVPQPVPGDFAVDRAALSPDGLRLAIVSADRRSLLEAGRATRDDPFGAPDIGAFVVLDDYAATTMSPGESFGDPVFGPDDRVLYYSQFGGGRTKTVVLTQRLFAGDPWPIGIALSTPELAAQGSSRRRPTALAADGRTLFFWDETSSTERAGFYAPDRVTFERFVDLGALRGAVPNGVCNRLYFSAGGQNSVDLFSAVRL